MPVEVLNLMRDMITSLLQPTGLDTSIIDLLTSLITVIVVILLCVLGRIFIKHTLIRLISRIIRNNRLAWDDFLLNRRLFDRISHLLPPIVISLFSPSFPAIKNWIEKGVNIYFAVVIYLIIDSLLNSAHDIYQTHKVSKTRPIKGFIQALKIAVILTEGIIVISQLINRSPLVILGGIGALTAVFLLIFQDSLLGFVAGIQLAANDMVRIGDWIEMPKYNAEGVVTEITLTTVKIENFDKTISTIPAHSMINDSFKNWRGMETSGGRRIKRSIYIDTNSIVLCSEEMLERFKGIELLRDYIEQKEKEIADYNASHNINLEEPANGRRLTNIGTFRAYIMNYLKNHAHIQRDMPLMVRQLAAEGRGLPLEVYAFTNTTKWALYENIQSDIFDHLYAVAPRFGLNIFQEPSGKDFSKALDSSKK
ncbi:MAG TPA: mechanosensitive ion channel [Clostridia bacterium]|nr:mechanosensitive ion channel [Clostridia bacterium]